MKTKLITLLAFVVAASTANAISWQTSKYLDRDVINQTISPNSQPLIGQFNLNDPNGDPLSDGDRLGYNSLLEKISALEMIFVFKNENLSKEVVSIVLGDVLSPLGTVFSIGEINPGDDINLNINSSVFSGSILLGLQKTGILDYSVTNTGQGVLTLKNALLAADTRAVPDQGALAGIFGSVVFCFALVRRRICRD